MAKKDQKIGITPETVEVKIEGENIDLNTSEGFITLNSIKGAVNKANPATVNASGNKGKKKKKVSNPEVQTAEEPKVVGHTKDGEEILEGEFKPVDSAGAPKTPKSNVPDVTRKDLPKMVADFRNALKGDLKNFVAMANASLSFKSRVYGALIREFADSQADFMERVLLETNDIKYIESFKFAVGAFTDENNMRAILNSLDTMKDDIDIRPNDIDKVEYERSYKRAVAGTKALFLEIKKETFEVDCFADRFAQFLTWAKNNEMFFITDGPEGCECGYRDCDGNLYDVSKKLYDPKAKKDVA